VQHVRFEQFGARLAVGAEHRGEHIHVVHVLQLRRAPGDLRVGLADPGQQPGPRRAGLDRDVHHRHVRQVLADAGDEGEGVLDHLVHAAAAVEVVVAGVEHHHARLVRHHDAIGVVGAVAYFRAAEAAVDHRGSGEILCQRGPPAD